MRGLNVRFKLNDVDERGKVLVQKCLAIDLDTLAKAYEIDIQISHENAIG